MKVNIGMRESCMGLTGEPQDQETAFPGADPWVNELCNEESKYFRSSSSVRLKFADSCYPMCSINGMAAFLETAAWNSNLVKIRQASWKLPLQSTETRALAGLLSQHIWHCAMISISECTSTYSLFFSQLLTPSVSIPRIACWRINRVLPVLHMTVLQTVLLST